MSILDVVKFRYRNFLRFGIGGGSPVEKNNEFYSGNRIAASWSFSSLSIRFSTALLAKPQMQSSKSEIRKTAKIKPRRILLFIVCMATFNNATPQQIGPELGKPASTAMVRAWNQDVFPEGEGLPEGQGNSVRGKKVFQTFCQSCHGVEGIGGSAEELAGAAHSLTDDPPDKTIGTYWPYATTIFDFTRRSMPLNVPGSLDNDQLYAVTAYLLYLNGIIAEQDVMNAKTLPAVKMPNRYGFINVYRHVISLKNKQQVVENLKRRRARLFLFK